MFFENIRFQIVSGAVLLIMILRFIRSNRLKLRSIRLFTLLLICSVVNLIADIATVYTITHMDTVPYWMNRACHMVFIATLDTLLYGLFHYVLAVSERGSCLCKKTQLLLALPYAASLIMTVFGELNYYNDGVIAYSYGPMVTVFYGCVAFYMGACNVMVILSRRSIRTSTRYAIHFATLIWVIAALLQSKNPGLLISGVSVMLMMLYLYLSIESPQEYIDQDSGCFNRRAMFLSLDEAFTAKQAPVVVNIVVEGLAAINHKQGYSASAQAIQGLAACAQQLFDADVFRYRGAGLALIVWDTPQKAAANAKQLLIQLVQPFQTEKGPVYLNCHIDLLPCNMLPVKNSHEVFETLDFLLEAAHLFASVPLLLVDKDVLAKKERMATLEMLLMRAVDEGGFNVVYQPIFCPETGTFSSAEALVRLADTKTLGFVSPEEFIPAAESKGYVNAIGFIVLDKVLAMASREKLWEKGMKYIEVNLSGLQASDPDLVRATKKLLSYYRVPPHFINYEITETAAISSGERLNENMQQLRDMGCSFSMDDFGTGYSNISQLVDVNYDLIKLDKSLIWPCFGDSPHAPRIVLQNVVGMVSGLHTKLVAEGVETAEQVALLQELGVHYLQGYHFSKPIPEDAFLAFLREHAAE